MIDINLNFNELASVLCGVFSLLIPVGYKIYNMRNVIRFNNIIETIVPIVADESIKFTEKHLSNEFKRDKIVKFIDKTAKEKFNIDLDDNTIDKIIVMAYHGIVKGRVKTNG